jgi:alkylation response protein AidB-like acyl-CoA dehydrogenase
MKQSQNPVNWIVIVGVAVGVLTFVVDKAVEYLHHAEQSATKPYVEKQAADIYAKIAEVEASTRIKLAELDAAAKLREVAVKDISFEHSDRNHDDALSRMKDVTADNRLLSQKIDSVLERLKTIEENTRKKNYK